MPANKIHSLLDWPWTFLPLPHVQSVEQPVNHTATTTPRQRLFSTDSDFPLISLWFLLIADNNEVRLGADELVKYSDVYFISAPVLIKCNFNWDASKFIQSLTCTVLSIIHNTSFHHTWNSLPSYMQNERQRNRTCDWGEQNGSIIIQLH